MRSIFKFSLIISIFSIILFSGCKKYVDGPSFSLLTKKSRLCGDWLIDQATFNGTDITDAYKTLAGANFKLVIEKSGSYSILGNFADSGKWKFGEDKDDVYFTSNTAGSAEQAYRILRLKSKELWLRSTASNGDISIIHYKAEKD